MSESFGSQHIHGEEGRPQIAIAIVGPTCSGKTKIGIELAKLVGGEIVSVDARQIYKLIDIGTAKPTREEMSQVPHHLVDILSLDDGLSAGIFAKLARDAVKEIFARDHMPIMVGGSGLYLRAIIDGLFELPEVDKEIRSKLRYRLETEGAETLLKELREVDPRVAEGLVPRNYKRILRALEIFYSSGKKISDFQITNLSLADFQTAQFGIRVERKTLYHRIERRVDEMISGGLVDEAKGILKRGFNSDLNSLQTTGYQEAIDFLQGKIKFDDMVSLIKRNTRRYAKRQMTWFRKDNRITWVEADEKNPREIAEEIQKRLVT